MAHHVPFSQRPSGRSSEQPVYIGFESPQRRRQNRKFNWWGFNGLTLFFISFGFLSPLALLISVVGLRRRPRKLAVAGTALSLVGTAVIALVIVGVVSEAQEMQQRRELAKYQQQVAGQVEQAESLLVFAADEFEGYRDEHDGRLPSHEDGSSLAIKNVDPWENEVMYNLDKESATLRSAGPDGEFFTEDDLTYEIPGKTEQQPLLPVDESELLY